MALTNPIFNPDDFLDSVFLDAGVTVSRTPITKVLASNGDENLVEGTPENITVVIKPEIDKFTQEKFALLKETDAIMHIAPTQTMAKEDKITYQGTSYRILNVKSRNVPTDGTVIYKFCQLRLIG